MAQYKIKQYTLKPDRLDPHGETVFDFNGCAVVRAVFISKLGKDFGFKVTSHIAEDNGKVVASGKNWSDVRTKARQYGKANFHRHIAHHNL